MMGTEYLQARIGAIYSNLSVKENLRKYTILLILLRHLRIYGLAYVITFLNPYIGLQSIYVVYSSLILVALMSLRHPFESPFIAKVEIANEFFILVLFSFLICQTEAV